MMCALKMILSSGILLAASAGAAPVAAQNYPGYGYGLNSQFAVNRCASAAQARLTGGGYYRSSARVLGVTGVQPLGNGMLVRGVADSGRYAAYAYLTRAPVDLSWQCSIDYRGFVTNISFGPAQPSYGYAPNSTQWNYDVSRYGYVRY